MQYHKISTDKQSMHSHCPPGSDSWSYSWRVAEANDTIQDYHHDPHLTSKVQSAIYKIYEDNLFLTNLLTRCLDGHTQNNNESYGVLWHYAPKHNFCGPKIISVAAFLAMSTFNDGFISLLKIMNILGIRFG